ncbi:MAG: division/cell wall cluster transcriptional repressor MraZ [Candidatus Edwardsbacteria bacterium]
MLFFSGTYYHTIDPKGRINIPASFRKIFGFQRNGTIVIARGLDQSCLLVYPQENWINKIKELQSLPKTEKTTAFLRILSASGQPTQIDNQGRIVIPPSLLEAVSLQKEEKVAIIGFADKMEIWKLSAYKAYLAKHKESFEKIARERL